jgi:two-component system, OmpR family, sensor histidine kinase KdpD
VLTTYAGQLALALAAQRLERQASEARLEADSNRLRAALLSSVSHDLRTPLSSIKAYASSLLQDDVTWRRADIDEFARSIVEESDRLNGLVTNLLDMSRLEAGSIRLHLQAVDLDDLVPAVLHALPFRDAPIVVALSDHLPDVSADPILLERIITNLIDNALKWSPTDATVTMRSATDGPDRVRLEVIDHGPGIPEEVRDDVFRPFQRLHDAGAHGQGAGLGLAVARGFARAMDGEVVVEDTPDGGTTAAIILPAAESGNAAATTGAQA